VNLRLVAWGDLFSSVPRSAAPAVAAGPGLRLLAVTVLLAAGSSGAAAPPNHGKPSRSPFTVGRYVEVARQPVSHKSVEYTFVAHVTNRGAAAAGVGCTVRWSHHDHDDDDDCDDDHEKGGPRSAERSGDGHRDGRPVFLDDTLTFGNVGAGRPCAASIRSGSAKGRRNTSRSIGFAGRAPRRRTTRLAPMPAPTRPSW